MDDALFAAVDAFCMSAPTTSMSDPVLTENLRYIICMVPAKASLGDLIREMGVYFTNVEGTVRRRATTLLSSVLEAAITGKNADFMLSRPEALHTLVGFFMDRLADYPSVPPCLKGLRLLLEFCSIHPSIYPSVAISVATAIFTHLHVQAMEQPLRQAVFEILLHLVSSPVHVSALTARASVSGASDAPYALDFAVGVVQAIDGEKDPRCLLIALHLVGRLLQSRTNGAFADAVAAYTQELFDVTACYFPITFTPPPNDPHGITKEALVSALRGVFTSTPRLAEFVIPLCMEKLSSHVAEAKRDALQTLAVVAESYGVITMSPYLSELAAAFKEEVLNMKDSENATGWSSSSPFFALWTGSGDAGPAAKLIGLSAGSLGMNFSGKADVYVNGAYGLYTPVHANGEASSLASAFSAKTEPPTAVRTIADEALGTIAEFTRILSVHVQSTGQVDAWHLFVSPLIKFGINETVHSAESFNGHAAARILCAVAAATHHALASVLESIVPCIELVHSDATNHHRVAVRTAVIALLAGLLHTVDHGVDHPPGGHPVSKHARFIFEILLQTLSVPLVEHPLDISKPGARPVNTLANADVEARCIAAAGLCDLAVRPPTALLGIEQKFHIAERFTSIVLNDSEDAVREACLRALCTMASVRRRFCNAVLVVAVPRLFAVITESMQEGSTPSHSGESTPRSEEAYTECFSDLHLPGVSLHVSRALYALGQLACISNLQVQYSVVPQLLDLAVDARVSMGASGEVVHTCKLRKAACSDAISIAVLETLGRVVATKSSVDCPEAMDAFWRHTAESRSTCRAYTRLGATSNSTPHVDDASSVHTGTSVSHLEEIGESILQFESAMEKLLRPSSTGILSSEDAEIPAFDESPATELTPVPPLLVPTLYQLAVDSTCPPADGARHHREGLPIRVRCAIELIFRAVATKASADCQDAFRLNITRAVMNGVADIAASGSFVLPAAPWFTPLASNAPISQTQLLPCFLKVLACSRKNATIASFATVALALARSLFDSRCSEVASCEDPQQRLTAKTIIDLARRAAGVDPRGGAGSLDEDFAIEVGAAGISAAARTLAVTHELSKDGAKPRSASNRLVLELHRAIVLTAQTVGVLFNRQPCTGVNKAEFDQCLKQIFLLIIEQSNLGASSLPHYTDVMRNTAASALDQQKAVLLLVWLGKGLALRGHAAAQICVSALVGVITRVDIPDASAHLVTLAGQGLGSILADPAPKHPFHKDTGATVLALYKQKLFSFAYAKLVALESGPVNDGSLIPLSLSLCAMATHLPQSLLLSEIDHVLPIVVRSLDSIRPAARSQDALPELATAVAMSSLVCLRTLIRHALAQVAAHVHTLVPVLISISQGDARVACGPVVRAIAVDCLRGFVSLPYHKVHPVKQTVVSGLIPVLDDPKRAIRKRAAACRNDWLTLGPSASAGK